MKTATGAILHFLFLAFCFSQPPSPIPVRINDGANKDLFLMTLGNVQTPLSQGQFDLKNDRVRLNDGRVIDHYFRDSLKIAFYRPIDKSVFPLPPSGWCSWYFYYQEIDEQEIMRNAEWISKNLKDFGADLVQIDDGWQGTGHGLGENRDWTTINGRFSSGMDRLASYIKSRGLRAGLWLAPHGQSNEEIVRNNPGVFLLKDDTSASNTWEGTYLVDPSTPAAHNYLSDLFTTLSGWGYDYFKIDGQPIVVREFREKQSFMRQPHTNTDSLYRSTLRTIRSAIGDNRYLLGCWGIPLEGTGIMNGSRTGGDIVLGWSGFKVALGATMRYYYLHNIVWYSDPDVMCVRAPLTLQQAQAWATLQGLTGQALLASDRMMDLSADRVDILRRVYPAVDIIPLDLFPSQRQKHVWDLKIHHLGNQYDVVGVFNYNEQKSEVHFVGWKDLGIETKRPVHVFDFWNREYLGAWEKGIALTLEPTSCRVLALVPMEDRPQIVSTSRHITQGWVDLMETTYDEKTQTYSGTSRVVKNDPYEIRFAFPRGIGMAVTTASAENLRVKVTNHQGWATVQFTSPLNADVKWKAAFGPAPYYHYPTNTPGGLRIQRAGINGANVSWSDNYNLNAGYQVYLNNALMGYTPMPAFSIRDLHLDSSYTVSVRTVWQDGRVSENDARMDFSPRAHVPHELWLSDIEPVSGTAGYRSVEYDKAVSGRPLLLGGITHERGIGTHAISDIIYNIHGLYETFTALVGIDENAGRDFGTVEFVVIGDGKELWRTRVMRKGDPPQSCTVSMRGVHLLHLKVTDAGDTNHYDHADWVNAKISR